MTTMNPVPALTSLLIAVAALIVALIYVDRRVDELERNQTKLTEVARAPAQGTLEHDASITTINETIGVLTKFDAATLKIMRALMNEAGK